MANESTISGWLRKLNKHEHITNKFSKVRQLKGETYFGWNRFDIGNQSIFICVFNANTLSYPMQAMIQTRQMDNFCKVYTIHRAKVNSERHWRTLRLCLVYRFQYLHREQIGATFFHVHTQNTEHKIHHESLLVVCRFVQWNPDTIIGGLLTHFSHMSLVENLHVSLAKYSFRWCSKRTELGDEFLYRWMCN